jgi:hypothetical protein
MPSIADLVEEPRLRELVGQDELLARGQALADGGSVRLRDAGPLGATAEVEDGTPRTVIFSTSGRGDLRWTCSCMPERFCAHATAAAIEVWRRAPKRRR